MMRSIFQKLFQNKQLSQNKQMVNKSQQVIKISPSIQENLDYIQNQLFHTNDLKWHRVQFDHREGLLIFLESITDPQKIEKEIIRQLDEKKEGDLREVITSVSFTKEYNLHNLPQLLLQAKCLLLLEGVTEGYTAFVGSVHKRNTDEPENEGIVRGAHDGFIENLSTNLYLVRNRIENPNLVVRYYELGRGTKTKVAVLYMQDIANPDLIQEIDKRLRSISTDVVISPGFIAEFIEDKPFSPFPQILFTERPDRTVSNLMEGRLVILAEGDPSALILPVTLFSFYQSPDDYHSRWVVGSFIRFIRLISFVIAFQLPALYIAVVAFHPEILPIDLIYTVKSTVERVPFPPLLEALFMELTIELIREAGIRLPSRVGQTIGIVGGLVIGDAVVRAGIVSYPMIIVVSSTAIASFLVPSHEMSTTVRILRFPLMILAAMFGLIGISIGLTFIFMHLCKLESLGTPYFAPFMPLRIKDLKDTFIRMPIWALNERPKDSNPKRMQQERMSREWEQDDQTK